MGIAGAEASVRQGQDSNLALARCEDGSRDSGWAFQYNVTRHGKQMLTNARNIHLYRQLGEDLTRDRPLIATA